MESRTRQRTHWHPGWYGIEPIVARGALRLELSLAHGSRHWEVRWREGARAAERSTVYGPRFAAGALAPLDLHPEKKRI